VRKKTNKPKKVVSIHGDGSTKKEVSEKIDLKEESAIEEPVKGEPIIEPVKSEPKPQTVVSPLLSEPVEVKEHALGVGPGPAPVQPTSFSMDQDFFSTPPVAHNNPQLGRNDLMSENPGMFPAPAPDAPEQSFNQAAGGGPIVDKAPIPDEIAKQGASELADTIMDLYKRAVPDFSYEFVKHKADDLNEIKKYEIDGKIMVGTVEDLRNSNKEVKKTLEERAKEDAAMIKKPLKKLLQVNNIQAPPHIELIIILLFVLVTYGMLLKGIKESNKELLSKIYAQVGKDKKESDIPFMTTEEVK
jgi:hypothetical protein